MLIHAQRIQLQPHMAKQRRQAAECDAVLAEGGMAFMMTDMRTHHLRREEIAHPALNGIALQRVVVVRDPEAMAAGQHFIIDTPAAGGAGFKLHLREALAQHIQQAVELSGLSVGGGFALMTGLHQLAVHIPLHIVHRMFTQQPAHALQQIIKGLRNIEVQHQLMATGRLWVTWQRQHPVRMRAIQIRIRVNHFRFNPDTKLHAEVFDVVDHRHQAVRVFFLVESPVAQRAVVVVAPFEPAVVDDKALHAQRGRFFGHPHDVFRVVTEVDPLPGIEMHRARFVLREANNIVAQIAVELLAHAVQPLRRVAGVKARRPQGFALLHLHFARQIQCFGLQIAATVGFGFRAQAVVTAPAQVNAPYVAVHFAKTCRAADKPWEVFV
ncbi:hypothetical protein D3C75_415410 [compost metagenome]